MLGPIKILALAASLLLAAGAQTRPPKAPEPDSELNVVLSGREPRQQLRCAPPVGVIDTEPIIVTSDYRFQRLQVGGSFAQEKAA